MKALFAASGTGGHLVPALRLAQAVKNEQPDCRILFVGGKRGLEKQMITAAGYELQQISARGFARRQLWKNLPVFWALGQSMWVCRQIVKRFQPDVAVGTGGYVTGPLIRAAFRAGVPTLIHEQNRRAGLTTRWLSRIADRVCVSFAETVSQLAHPERVRVTGNPLDHQTIGLDRKTAAAEFNLNPDRPTILITGGSQGAQSINENIKRHLAAGRLSQSPQLIWQTGRLHYGNYQHLSSEEKGINVQAFIPDLTVAMAAADLIIARAGALTLAEVTARGLPALLVPYPQAAADHQTENAQALVDAKAAIMITDRELTEVDLLADAGEILADQQKLKQMSENSQKLGRPGATAEITAEILRLVDESQPD